MCGKLLCGKNYFYYFYYFFILLGPDVNAVSNPITQILRFESGLWFFEQFQIFKNNKNNFYHIICGKNYCVVNYYVVKIIFIIFIIFLYY